MDEGDSFGQRLAKERAFLIAFMLPPSYLIDSLT